MSSLGIQIRVLDSIEDIDMAKWENLTIDGSLYTSYEWLHREEERRLVDSYYVTAWSNEEELIGGLACYAPKVDFNKRYSLRALLNNNSLPRAKQIIYMGNMSGYHCGIRTHPRLDRLETEMVSVQIINTVKKSRGT